MSFREALDMQIARLEPEIAANPDDSRALGLKTLLILLRDKAMRPSQTTVASSAPMRTAANDDEANDEATEN
jgi:hypothetical protein